MSQTLASTQKSSLSNSSPIDLVYLWVNPKDEDWFVRREAALKLFPNVRNKHGAEPCRYQDNGELIFSLRSAGLYLPFIRKLFIVLDGAPPEWLDTSREDFEIVSAQSLLPKQGVRPTFSSESIEAFVHKIPGLSEYYLYSNDDFFVCKPATPSDFFEPDGTGLVRMEKGLIHAPLMVRDNTYNHIWRNSFKSLKSHLSDNFKPNVSGKVWVPLWIRKLFRDQLPLNPPAHILQPMRKSVWRNFHEAFGDEMKQQLKHPFRNPESFAVNMMFYYLSHSLGKAKFIYTEDFAVAYRESSLTSIQHAFETIRKQQKVRFFCLNDGFDLNGVNWGHMVKEVLETCFPNPGRWEKQSFKRSREG